jgi:hypothetical protein
MKKSLLLSATRTLSLFLSLSLVSLSLILDL